MRGVAMILAVVACGVGIWALVTERYLFAAAAGVVELALWAVTQRSLPAGANPHSMGRGAHVDR